jgi:phosphoribosylglycinamide formyltransferase-1
MSFRMVVLISGSGSNLQAILNACGQAATATAPVSIPGSVVGVLSNKADAYGLVRAQHAGVATAVLAHTDFADRTEFDAAMLKQIDVWQADVVVLAGFMRILSPGFVNALKGRLINIHPSLLPKYKGLHTHQRALDAGERIHGCSVHFVTPELDGGPVIAQAVVDVRDDDSVETLAARVHAAEHRLYPTVLSWLAQRRLFLDAGQIYFDGQSLNAAQQLAT